MLGSARATNEENYLAQKFARVVLGTNNVDCCARVCHAPTAAAMKTMLGTGAATNSFDDIEQARAIPPLRREPDRESPGRRRAHQAGGLARREADRDRSAQHRAGATTPTIHLALRPGTNIPLLNAMAARIVEEDLADDAAFVRERVERLGGISRVHLRVGHPRKWRASAASPRRIRRAARLYATTKPAMCFTAWA